MLRVVLDASILVRAVKPTDGGHSESVELFRLLREKVSEGIIEIYEPPEFLLESAAVLHRQQKDVNSAPLNFLSQDSGLRFRDVVFITEKDVTSFITILQQKYGDQAFKTKGADVIYLILAWRLNATLVTADKGLLQYSDHFKVISPAMFIETFKSSNEKRRNKKLIWIEKNREKIRAAALASYHRNKKTKVSGRGRPRLDGSNLIAPTYSDDINRK